MNRLGNVLIISLFLLLGFGGIDISYAFQKGPLDNIFQKSDAERYREKLRQRGFDKLKDGLESWRRYENNVAAEKDKQRKAYWTHPLGIDEISVVIGIERFAGQFEDNHYDIVYLKVEQGVGFDVNDVGYEEHAADCDVGKHVIFGRYETQYHPRYQLVLDAFQKGLKVRLKLAGCKLDSDNTVLAVRGVSLARQ